MSSKINIEQLEEYLKQAGLENGKLEEVLSPIKELNNQRRYGLVWEEPDNTTYGSDSAEQDLLKNFPFLKEVSEHRIFNGEEHPDHLLIEGDNLHALKTMQYTHKNKVDVIYIDPPYNTGNTDFVYNDKYVDNEDSWRHSKWLSFMNKRLRLARELMTDEGVIFISIDDNELYQLKLLCDQIFGEDNFVANLIWKSGGGKSDSRYLASKKEYALVYKKGNLKEFNKKDSPIKNYKLVDEDGRRYNLAGFDRKGLRYSKSLDYPIEAPDGSLIYPGKSKELYEKRQEGDYDTRDWSWTLSRKEFNRRDSLGDIVFKNTKNGWRVYYKSYYENKKSPYEDIYEGSGNQVSSKEIKDLFDGRRVFDYSKPINYVKHLVNLHPNKNATVLDFFAGSGTTAHAVMELNEEDGGNRQAIVITNNEINSSEEEDLLVEKGYVEPFTGSRRGTKKHSEWLESVNEFKQTPEYLEFNETDEYKDLGIARAVTEQRINKVINGYTTPEGKEVEGLDNNNFYHFEVVLEPDLMDMDLNTYVLVNKTKDIIRIKEGVYTKEEDISTETVPSVKLTDKDKEVIVVLSVRVTDSDIEELVQNFNDEDKQHIIYTSYTGFEYGINNIRFEELPKELLQAIKHDENN